MHLDCRLQVHEDNRNKSSRTLCVSMSVNIPKFEEQISKFWRTEQISSVTIYTLEEKACRKNVETTLQRDKQGRFR